MEGTTNTFSFLDQVRCRVGRCQQQTSMHYSGLLGFSIGGDDCAGETPWCLARPPIRCNGHEFHRSVHEFTAVLHMGATRLPQLLWRETIHRKPVVLVVNSCDKLVLVGILVSLPQTPVLAYLT